MTCSFYSKSKYERHIKECFKIKFGKFNELIEDYVYFRNI